MKVTCSGCGRTLNVPDTALGKTVRCPACKTTVKIEETFSVMPDTPSTYESEAQAQGPVDAPAAAPAAAEAGAPPAGVCPNCGFPVLPDAGHCNRCGTDLATGEKRTELVGYSASLKTRVLGKTGWIVTLAVTGVIAAIVLAVVVRARGLAVKALEEEKRAERARRMEEEAERARQAAAIPKGPEKPEETRKPAAPRKEDIAAAFEGAFGCLVNPSPSTQGEGIVRITNMGAQAVPLIGNKLADCAGSGEGDATARKMLARVLGKIHEGGASSLLVGLLTDADANVRTEALEALVGHGPVAQDALTAALESDAAPRRAAGALAARRLQFAEHTPILLMLLEDRDPAVSIQAAGALEARPGTPDIHAALVLAVERDELDVAAAASRALFRQKGAFDIVVKSLTRGEATSEALRSPRTFFLAMPILAWKAPIGLKTLSRYLGGGRSGPEVLGYIEKFLDVRNAVTRVESLREARLSSLGEPQMVVAAGLCIADVNDFVAREALAYISSLDEFDFPLPLVVALGDEDAEFAISVAGELARRTGEATAGALRRAVEGTTPQRRVMAAGVLARRGDDRGADLLREVALGGYHGRGQGLSPPLAGWAAYQHSFLEKGQDSAAFAERAKNSPSNLDRAYYAAAAARLGSEEMLAELRGQLGPTSKGFHARLVVRLLGELKDADAKDALTYQLHKSDPELLAAVVGALRALGDPSVVEAVVERSARVKPETASVLRDAVTSFGQEAEPYILKQLGHQSPLVRRAAMDCLTEFGTRASKGVRQKLVEIIQDTKCKKDLKKGVPKVLSAITGIKEKPHWTWRDWAKACRISVKDLSEAVEYKRMTKSWLSMDVPKNWKSYAGKASDPRAVGSPEISTKVFSDPPGTPKSKRKYSSERDYRKKRKIQLALVSRAGGGKIKPGLKVSDEGNFTRGKTRMVGMRLIDKKLGKTSYYVFLFARSRKAHYYAEICFKADTRHYDMYKTLFEKRIIASVKADLE